MPAFQEEVAIHTEESIARYIRSMNNKLAGELYKCLTVLRLQHMRGDLSNAAAESLAIYFAPSAYSEDYDPSTITLGKKYGVTKVELVQPMDKKLLLQEIENGSTVITMGSVLGMPGRYIARVWSPGEGDTQPFSQEDLARLLVSPHQEVRLAAIQVLPLLDREWERSPVFKAEAKRMAKAETVRKIHAS